MLGKISNVIVLGVVLFNLAFWGGMPNAHAIAPGSTCGYPAGPKSGIMTVDVNEYKSCGTLQGLAPPGYIWTSLSSMPADSPITNGVHPGYCVDLTGTIMDNPMFGNIVYSVTFWSSQDPGLPSSLKSVQKDGKTYTIPWDKINYLINTYPNESWLNIQAALWDLVHDCQQLPGSLYTCDTLRPAPNYFPFGPSAPYGCQNSNPPVVDIAQVQAMVVDANLHGSGFVSKAGDRIASVGQITNCTPSTVCNQYLPYQVIFVPSSCPTCTGSVGDYVWKDINGNGIQDSGEPGIPGVNVNLTGTDDRGQAINLTTTTDGLGKYQFSQLCTGTYSVSVDETTLPSGLKPSGQNSLNGDDNIPNDSNVATGTSVTISNDSTSNLTIDFGYKPDCTGSIGDYVWKDLDNNGLQNSGEPAFPGITLNLNGTTIYGVPVALSATTDINGIYSFTGLCQGNYNVSVDTSTVPASFVPTFSTSANGDDGVGNDSNVASGTGVYLPGDNSSNVNVDFGYTPKCSGVIGDYVWKDFNENGKQDIGEPGIKGAEVFLSGTNSYGQLISMTTSTDADGKYSFPGICDGTYTVTVNPSTVPLGFIPTEPLSANGSDLVANDSNNPAGTTLKLTGDSAVNLTVDFGYVPFCTGTIGDVVWTDYNGNGLQDDGIASGINNVEVLLTGTTQYGQAVNLSQITMNGGIYQFTGLCKGTYTVAVNGGTLPNGSVPTSPLSAAGNDMVPDDSNNPSGTSVTLANDATVNPTVDFGYFIPALIGDRVWIDANGNGIQDGGETGLAGVLVTLYNCADNGAVKSTTTDESGYYNFTVIPGSYFVVFSTPNGYSFTLRYASGSTIANDSNADASGATECITVASGQEDLTIDAGLVKIPVTANCVMIKAIQGIAITPVTMTATGGAGAPFSFSATGLPAGLTMSSTGTISGTPTVSGDFSYTVTITDKDGNVGTFNCSVTVNPPISANCVMIKAVQGIAITPVTMTATGGAGAPYTFSATGLPAGLTMSSTGTISGTPTASGTFSYTVTIKDKDGNIGTFNCSVMVEPPPVCVPCKEGVKQVTLKLDWRVASGDPNERIRVRADSLTGTVLYDSLTDNIPGNGLAVGTSFTFTVPLSAKSFVVTVLGANHRKETVKATFSAECDLTVGQTSVNTYITFKVMDVVLDGDLNCPTTSIGDYVWKDSNKDGIQDTNEAGVAGVSVKLFTCGGVTPLATTTTDASGKYLFSNLDPGDYSIQFVLPSGYVFSPKDQGLLDTLDSDVDTITGATACTTLMAGESDLSWDAGIYKPTTSTGCTYTIGYWKNHSGFGPQPDVVTPLLPQYLGTPGGTKTISVTTVKIAADILSQNVYGNSSNGITKLYAQLLAAKLNAKAGADSTNVDGIISAADAFLATKGYSDWSMLSSSVMTQVLAWHDALDDYNNGLAGPGHCGSQDVVPCISIDKKISADNKTWLDADTQAAALVRSSLSTVYYKLVVNNCGLVGLTNIQVNDPNLGISGYTVSNLAAGASAVLTYTQIPKLKASNQCSTAGSFENVATAAADYQGIAVSAGDSAWLTCNVTTACIDITKDISVDGGATWKPADTQATAPTVAAPHDAYYRLTVKNCGSSSLSNVVVKDEELGITGYAISSLSAGASKVLTSKTSGLSQLYDRSACSTSGIFSNTAIVTGFSGTKSVADSDIAWLVCTSTTSGGCSYTQGYWKTHTIYDGAKKRNNTWDKVGGENQLFFKTGQSWYEVLMTEPSTGNAYYILAHQYIAATLNKLSGADASSVDFELKHAMQLLDKYDGYPMKMEDITGSVRDDFIATASRLDQYNNGLVGPGHCK